MSIELILAAALTYGGPPSPPGAGDDDTVHHITVYDDDPARGAHECRIRLAELAPATCQVQPTSAGPDLESPGWADSLAPDWAGGA